MVLSGLLSDMCLDPKKIQDSELAGAKICDLNGSWILYSHFVQRVHKYPGSCHEMIAAGPYARLVSRAENVSLDHVNLGSCADKLLQDPGHLKSVAVVLSLYHPDPELLIVFKPANRFFFALTFTVGFCPQDM